VRPIWTSIAPLLGVQDATESIAGLFANLLAALGHTDALGALWVIWKTRNRRVFDGITIAPLPLPAIAILLEEHLKLWVCRASRKIDGEPLLFWCRSLAM
jgi:hypothetical protein